MLVFDEVEDVFNDGGGIFGRPSTAQTHKAWINRALETGAVPTIWLSNSISQVDAAFIRRFDMVILPQRIICVVDCSISSAALTTRAFIE